MKYVIDETACVDCGACRRYCPVDCVVYRKLQHQIDLSRCIGCVICYAVCPADAVIPIADSGPTPESSWATLERIRVHVFRRAPRQILSIDPVAPEQRSQQSPAIQHPDSW
jgi:ferredoxin